MVASLDQLGNVPQKNKDAVADVLAACAKKGIVLQQVWGVGGGDHADGYASDFMVYGNRGWGDWIADYVWSNRDRLGVRWEIWYQRIRSTTMPSNSYGPGLVWNPMPDRGSTTQNHMDHVHVKWTTAPVKPLVVPKPTPLPTGPRIRVANLKYRASNADIKAYNALLWKWQGPVYKARNLAAWMRESSSVYGPMTEKVTYDTYAYLHSKEIHLPQSQWQWGPPPTHPATPGPKLIRRLGGVPV